MGSVTLSTVVIGLNEAAGIEAALKAALEASERTGVSFEVLYVDSGSSDNSVAIAAGVEGVRILQVKTRPASAAIARNLGIRNARGEFVQLLDGDMLLDPEWLKLGLNAMVDDHTAAVSGDLDEQNARPTVWNFLMGLDWYRSPGVCEAVGGAALWRRSALESLSGFDESIRLGEDPELSLRARQQDWHMRHIDARMTAHDLAINTFRAYWNRARAVGRSLASVYRHHPDVLWARSRIIRPIRWCAAALTLIVGAAFLGPIAWGVVAGGFALLIARSARQNRRRPMPLSHAIPYALHLYFMKLPVSMGALGELWRTRGQAPAKSRQQIALLAPEIPSVSATFVYREIRWLRELGVTVVPISIHPVQLENAPHSLQALQAETQVLYASRAKLLTGAGLMVLTHPLRSLRTIGTAMRDLLRGEMAQKRHRNRLPAQCMAGLALARRLRAERVSHLHVQFANAPATVGMYAALAAGIPFSVTSHANDLFVEGSLINEKVARSGFFRTISNWNIRHLREWLGRTPPELRLIHCGVDLRAMPVAGRSKPIGGQLLTVARLTAKKGVDLLIDAVHLAQDRVPDIHLDILGDGPDRDDLEAQVARLGIQARVTFHGPVAANFVLEKVQVSDAFVLPCRVAADGDVDGIPVALMEAMAIGIPVVSTPISGVPELIVDNESGLLVEPENATALANGLVRLLTDDVLWARLVRGGRARVEAEFDGRMNTANVRDAMQASSHSRAAA